MLSPTTGQTGQAAQSQALTPLLAAQVVPAGAGSSLSSGLSASAGTPTILTVPGSAIAPASPSLQFISPLPGGTAGSGGSLIGDDATMPLGRLVGAATVVAPPIVGSQPHPLLPASGGTTPPPPLETPSPMLTATVQQSAPAMGAVNLGDALAAYTAARSGSLNPGSPYVDPSFIIATASP